MLKPRRFTAFMLGALAALVLGVAVLALEQRSGPASRAGVSKADTAAKADAASAADSSLKKATFAGGCFWCVESAFQDLAGVQSAVSGFSGGTKANPTYEEVSSGQTDHAEAVQVTYDPDEIGYERLLHVYWRQIDPTDADGQFADRGAQYRPVIFYHSERQERLAEQSKQELAESDLFDDPIAVEIQPFTGFHPAEEYHQDYYKKHPARYKEYYEGSGRGPFLRRVWEGAELWSEEMQTNAEQKSTQQASAQQPSSAQGASWRGFEKPSKATLKEQLSPMQYRVTQQNGTEPAFNNKYWDNKRAGLYVDVVSGEPLFSSKTKFESGTGWPSFYKPLEPELIVEKEDRSLGMVRTEVRSRYADSHLGHVFEWSSEPEVPTGLRYCLNSAALRFIPADQLEEEGYGAYKDLFE